MQTSLANKYARALVEVAVESGTETQVLRELRQFAELFDVHLELRETLLNPAISFAPKRAIVEQVCRALGCGSAVVNFLLVVLENGRIGNLPKLTQAVEGVLDKLRGIVQAELCSAAELGSREKTRLEKSVGELTGRQVRLSFRVDPGLLGGMKLQIGSEIFDGSVRTQLEEMERELVRE